MSIKAVLFDLDGTLLPLNQYEFTNKYFKLLTDSLKDFGYNPDELTSAVWKGTSAMVNNDGSKSNKKAFWEIFSKYYPENTSDSEKYFTDFYNTDFQKARDFCGFNPKANIAVNTAKNMGYKTILATNPIFPALATESRIYWAGLNPSSFEFYTSYENMGFSKPNIKYYTEIANRIGLLPEECLMVGNDVDEDMIAESIGMKVFLLTDCLVNTNNKDISLYENGDFDKLIEYIKTMNNH